MQRYQNIQRTIATERPEEDSGSQICDPVPAGGGGGGGSDSEAESSSLGMASGYRWDGRWIRESREVGKIQEEKDVWPQQGKNRQKCLTRNVKEKWTHSEENLYLCIKVIFFQCLNHFLLCKFIYWCPKDVFHLKVKDANKNSRSPSKEPRDNYRNKTCLYLE